MRLRCAKRKKALRQIAKRHHNYRRCYQGKRRMLLPAKRFDKKFQQHVVEPHATHGHQKIPHKLNPPPQVRALKHYVHAQIKTNGEGDEEGHEKGRHVRRKRNKAEVQDLFVQHVIKEDVIKKNVEQRVAAAAGRIVIGLNGHEAFEQGIKNIQ